MRYASPGEQGSLIKLQKNYGNFFINGEFIEPVNGNYFTNTQNRALALLKIADRLEQNLEYLAVNETWDNGKPVRETFP